MFIILGALIAAAALHFVGSRYSLEVQSNRRTIRLDRWTGRSWVLSLEDTPFWQPIEEVNHKSWSEFLEWRRTNPSGSPVINHTN